MQDITANAAVYAVLRNYLAWSLFPVFSFFSNLMWELIFFPQLRYFGMCGESQNVETHRPFLLQPPACLALVRSGLGFVLGGREGRRHGSTYSASPLVLVD